MHILYQQSDACLFGSHLPASKHGVAAMTIAIQTGALLHSFCPLFRRSHMQVTDDGGLSGSQIFLIQMERSAAPLPPSLPSVVAESHWMALQEVVDWAVVSG